MREKLNSNPILQAALIGLLGVAVAFLLVTRVLNRGGDPPPADAPVATETAAPAPAATDPTAAAPAAPSAPATPSSPAPQPAPGVVTAESFKAGPGLPKDVVAAYDNDRTVVVLIIRGNASDDQRLRTTVEKLRGRTDVELFVVKAADIAKFSRIAQGVNVNRTPALIVVEPKRLAKGPLPTATVSYGFRGLKSAAQAVNDSQYKGKSNLPFYP
jgi:hypothetical protein